MRILPTLALALLLCAPVAAQTTSGQSTNLPRSTTNIGDTSPGGSSLRYRKPGPRKNLGGSSRVRDTSPRGSTLKYRGKYKSKTRRARPARRTMRRTSTGR